MAFSFPVYDTSVHRLPLFGLFVWRFTLWVRKQLWTELRWGMALSDHHYTSPSFHLHLIIFISQWERARASVCLCTPCYHVFRLRLQARTAEKVDAEEEERWDEDRERKEYPYDTAITPHAGSICTLLFVSLLEKKQVIYQAWRSSWSLFPWLSCFVCLCLSSMCKFPQNIRSDNHSFCLCALTHLWERTAAVFPLKNHNSRILEQMLYRFEPSNKTFSCVFCFNQVSHQWPGHGADGEADPEVEPSRFRSHPALVGVNTTHCHKFGFTSQIIGYSSNLK